VAARKSWGVCHLVAVKERMVLDKGWIGVRLVCESRARKQHVKKRGKTIAGRLIVSFTSVPSAISMYNTHSLSSTQ